MGDRIQARPIDDPDLREVLTQGAEERHSRATACGSTSHKGLIEGSVRQCARSAVFKGFWSRLDIEASLPAAGCGFLDGLGQGLRGTQDDFGPERRQGRQAPSALAFCGTCLLKTV